MFCAGTLQSDSILRVLVLQKGNAKLIQMDRLVEELTRQTVSKPCFAWGTAHVYIRKRPMRIWKSRTESPLDQYTSPRPYSMTGLVAAFAGPVRMLPSQLVKIYI